MIIQEWSRDVLRVEISDIIYVVVDTVVVVSLLIRSAHTINEGGWTYVQEESPFTTVEGVRDISFVDVCSIYASALSLKPHLPFIASQGEKQRHTVKSQSDLSLVVTVANNLNTRLPLGKWRGSSEKSESSE